MEQLAIKGLTPVSYSYETQDRECSEIEFLRNTTGKKLNGVRIDNIYEIHWDNLEKHQKLFGFIETPKMYTCNFWGIGIEYGEASATAAPHSAE